MHGPMDMKLCYVVSSGKEGFPSVIH